MLAKALAKRDEARSNIRGRLSPVGQTLLDDIGAYDRNRSDENMQRLISFRHEAGAVEGPSSPPDMPMSTRDSP